MVDNQAGDQFSLVIQDLRHNDKFYDIECEPDTSVEDLKCLLEVQSGV